MVTFNKDSFSIDVHTGFNPVNEWLNTCNGLCDLLHNVNEDNIIPETYSSVIYLLQNMLPDYETAKKMFDC